MKYDLWQTEREKAKSTAKGLKILCQNTDTAKPILKVWKPKATKPYVHYYFKSISSRADYLKKVIKQYDEHLNRKNEYKESRKPDFEAVKELKKGDLFVTSWGYDQTNYDYIAVLSVSPTGKTAKCQRTKALHMGTSCQSNVQEPIFCPFGDIFTLQVRTGFDKGIALVGSYPFCHNGTGSKRKGWFSKAEPGRQYHETMPEFGH